MVPSEEGTTLIVIDTIGLIQRRFRLSSSDQSRRSLSQFDQLASLAADILRAPLAAIIYRPSPHDEAVLLAVQGQDAAPGDNLLRFKDNQYGRDDTTAMGKWYAVDRSAEESPADLVGYGARYERALRLDDSGTVVLVAYVREQTGTDAEAIDSKTLAICRLAGQALAQMRQQRDIKDFSLKLAKLLEVFELPVTELKYRQLLTEMVSVLSRGLQLDGICLLARSTEGGDYSVLEFRSQDPQRSGLATEMGDALEQLRRCHRDGSDEDQTELAVKGWGPGVLSHWICPNDGHSLALVVWTDRPDGFAESDRELLRLYSLMARTTLRNAAALRDALMSQRAAQQSSSRLADNEALAALTDMTSGVAHDINNIIGGILGRLELMKMKAQDDSLVQQLTRLEQLAMEGAETVRRIQEFATSARYRELEPVDLCELVRECVSGQSGSQLDLARQRGIEVALRIEPDEAMVDAASGKLIALLDQLLRNALEHSPEGGTVVVRIVADRQGYRLTVTDNGPGIPEDLRNKIFYPFFTTKKAQRGAGLGLSIVHGIAVRHGGSVILETEEGKGTTIGVTLPRPVPNKDDTDVTRRIRIPQKRAILVVDDDPGIREILSDMLMIEGLDAVACEDGFKALDALRTRNFDLIITDLGMPGMSGMELAALVHEANPTLPIAIITGWGIQLDDREIRQKGVRIVIAKPFHLNDLKKIIHDLLAVPA